MYQTEHWKDVLKIGARVPRRHLPLTNTVLFLGLTSMFTDISSEMVSTILPIYLMLSLQLSPLQFGVVDGLYQGVAAVMAVGCAFAADRWHRHKEIASSGYGLSAICKLALITVGSAWLAISAVIVADRIGKGIRTAPRDAMISLSTPRSDLATAFGIHRALDTTGAMIGPLVAFALLAAVPGGFDVIFVTSFCLALVGLGTIVLFVPPAGTDRSLEVRRPTLRSSVALLAAPRFRLVVSVAAMLSLVTISDSFVYLSLQRRLSFDASFFPLLYVGAALVYLLVAIPVGQLADHFGRARVFVGGYVLLLLAYVILLLPVTSTWLLVGCLVLVGTSAATTDGVLMALASDRLSDYAQASGLALLKTGTSLARLVSSVVFGALWTVVGVEVTVSIFMVGLISATALGWFVLNRDRSMMLDESTSAA
jgi:MFS family permease